MGLGLCFKLPFVKRHISLTRIVYVTLSWKVKINSENTAFTS